MTDSVKRAIEALEELLADDNHGFRLEAARELLSRNPLISCGRGGESAPSAYARMPTRGEAMTPTRYRKKPVEIEAMQFSGTAQLVDVYALADWCGGTFERDTNPGQEMKTYYWSINIPTLEGTMRASVGDWIIRGVHGEFYPCKPDIFEATYEPVEASSSNGSGS